jgi:hypothetical protein
MLVDRSGFAAPGDDEVKFAGHTPARQRCVGDGKALPSAHIVDGENPEVPAEDELVGHKIQGPQIVRSCRDHHGRTCS